jgi:hypothetical protein
MSDPTNLTPLPPEGEPEPVQSPDAPGHDPQSPMIVIEYRQRGLFALLAPPALLLMGALLITAYQRKTPIPLAAYRPRPGGPEVASRVTPAEADDAGSGSLVRAVPREERDRQAGGDPKKEGQGQDAPKPSEPASIPAPDRPSPEPAGPAPVATDSPFDDLSPFDLNASEGLRPVDPQQPAPGGPRREPVAEIPPDPNEPVPAPAADPASRPGSPFARGLPDQPGPPGEAPPAGMSQKEILDDIQDEAERNEARRQSLAGLKSNARNLLFAEAIAKVEESREAFRKELAQVVAEFGSRAAPQIDQLCEQYGREVLPEIRMYYDRARNRMSTPPMTHTDDVAFMRSCGLPEPVILDVLCHKLHKSSLRTRGGPRDEHEVRILAAKVLLRVPVATPRKRAPSASTTTTSPRPFASTVAPAAP